MDLSDKRDRERVDVDCCACCSQDCQGRFFVGFVTTLIFFCWATFWVGYVVPWALWSSILGCIHILFFNIVVFMTYYCYNKTVNTPPGFVPAGWVPPGISEAELQEAKQNTRKPNKRELIHPNAPRWCAPCQKFKPPRSHHCKELGDCVVRMDHFCPWVNNCVGFKNHKFFILFLWYAIIGLADFLLSFIWRVIADGIAHPTDVNPTDLVLLIIHFIITFPMTIMIAALAVSQFFTAIENCTSIESRSYENWRYYFRRQNMKFIWMYDQGTKQNFREFFGNSVSEWFLPYEPQLCRESDGTEWRMKIPPPPITTTEQPAPEPTQDVVLEMDDQATKRYPKYQI